LIVRYEYIRGEGRSSNPVQENQNSYGSSPAHTLPALERDVNNTRGSYFVGALLLDFTNKASKEIGDAIQDCSLDFKGRKKVFI
jgi:hypothetical protein